MEVPPGSEPADQLSQAAAATGELIAALRPQDWQADTVCAGWQVTDVVQHLVTGQYSVAARLAGQPPAAAGPAAVQPTAAQPTAAQPPAAQPTAAQPPAAQPTAAQAPAAQPAATQPAAAQPAAAQPAAAQAPAAQPAAAQPAAAQPTAAQPAAAQPAAGQPSGDALAAAYRESAGQMLAAFRQPGALQQVLTVPFGTVPGIVALNLRLTELLVHGWDIARAARVAPAFPAGLAEQALAFTQANLASVPADRRPFAPPQPVPGSAPAIDRLAALLGLPVTAPPAARPGDARAGG